VSFHSLCAVTYEDLFAFRMHIPCFTHCCVFYGRWAKVPGSVVCDHQLSRFAISLSFHHLEYYHARLHHSEPQWIAQQGSSFMTRIKGSCQALAINCVRNYVESTTTHILRWHPIYPCTGVRLRPDIYSTHRANQKKTE
jgi:hypothetical protein